MAEEPQPKRPRAGSALPQDLREKIEQSLAAIGEVEHRKKSHKKGPGPVGSRCLPAEALVHEKTETIRKGQGNRTHFRCSNPRCEEPIRQDKWDTHVVKSTTDLHLQEPPEAVLERSCNFAPDGEWDNKESRMQRIVSFMEQRHYLALARAHDDTELVKRLTAANTFYVRLTTMVRASDPTSKSFLSHYARHYKPGSTDELANLILNIAWVRNTMSKEVVRLCEQGSMPWLTIEHGRVSDESKKAADATFLMLGGRVFFLHVEPMKSRSKSQRRGWGELASELTFFCQKGSRPRGRVARGECSGEPRKSDPEDQWLRRQRLELRADGGR